MTRLDADLVRRKLAAITGFLSVSRQAVVPSELATTLAPAAGLRNRLVHVYEEINDAIVFRAVGEARWSFAKYVPAIDRFVTGKGV